MPITHAKVSAKPDTADTTKIQPSDWNDPHEIDIFVDDEVPAGDVDGSNPTFTLDHTPSPATSLRLYNNGILQYSVTHYTISGDTIVFEDGFIPHEDDSLRAFYRKA